MIHDAYTMGMKFRILTMNRMERVQMRHRAKFGGN